MNSPRKYTCKDGIQTWKLNGQYHRLNKPAIIFPNGTQKWVVNNNLHRPDGPAAIWADGRQEWWVDDNRYRDNKSFQEAAGITDEEMTFLIMKYGNVT